MKPGKFRFREMHFENQLLVLVIAPLLFLTIAVSLVASYALQNVTRDLILQRNTTMINLTASGILQELNGYLRPLVATAAELAALPPGEFTSQQRLLESQQGFLSIFDGGVTLLDATGRGVASTPGQAGRVGLSYAFRDYFKEVEQTRSPVFSTVLVEVPSGQQAVVMAVPLMRESRFSGVLIGVMFLKTHLWVTDFKVLLEQPDNQVYLVDPNGTIIYNPDATLIGSRISTEPVLAKLLEEGRTQSIVYRSERSGVDRVVSFAPVSGTRWNLLMEEPWQPLFAPSISYLWYLIIFMIVGLAISMALLIIGLRRGIRPLLTLMAEARNVSAGGAFEPLDEDGPQELRTLIRTFNQMVTNLEIQQRTLRNYAMQILNSQEEERRRISRDLHDETVQDLVGLSQRLELCRTVLVRDPATARMRLDELQMLTERALADVRRMSNDLRPLILEDLGLVPALRKLCRSLETDLPTAVIECQINGNERRLSPELELVVFRVVQEALNNIRKHGRSATRVEISLRYGSDSIFAEVGDNGPGFEMVSVDESMRQGHLGLAGMVERTRLFGGELVIQSKPGSGTQISLRLPV